MTEASAVAVAMTEAEASAVASAVTEVSAVAVVTEAAVTETYAPAIPVAVWGLVPFFFGNFF